MKKKRNHYVPKWYQEFFAVPGKELPLIWVYDKDNPDDVPQLRQPVNTGLEGHLYTFTNEEGQQDDSLEDIFSKQEGNVQPIIRHWLEPKAKLTKDEISSTAEFVATLFVRVPRIIDATREVEQAFAVGELREIANDPEKQRRAFNGLKAQGKLEGIESVEELREAFENFEEKFEIETDRTHAMAMSLTLIGGITEAFLRMNWCLCVAPDDASFITCDCPVNVFFPAGRGRVAFGAGIGMPGVKISLSLSPRVCLLLDYETTQRRRRVEKSFVNEVNRRMVAGAERFIFASFDAKQIREWVKRYAHTRGRPKIDKEFVIRRAQMDRERRRQAS